MPTPLVPTLMAMVALAASTTLFLREYAPPPPPAPPAPPAPPLPPLKGLIVLPVAPATPAVPLSPPPPAPITATVLKVLFQSAGTVQLEPDVKMIILGWRTTQPGNV